MSKNAKNVDSNAEQVLIVHGIECKICEDTIFSRARHDFRTCSCGAASIDGGQEDYIKISGDIKNIIQKVINLPDNPTKQMLYDDWNKGIDKYGLIKKYG